MTQLSFAAKIHGLLELAGSIRAAEQAIENSNGAVVADKMLTVADKLQKTVELTTDLFDSAGRFIAKERLVRDWMPTLPNMRSDYPTGSPPS